MEESVDILDQNSLEVVDTVDKSEAHQRGLLHACVIAEIINSKGEWILVEQSASRQDPGQFVSPVGGHVTSGETYEEALIREAAEEVGFTDFEYQLVGQKIYNREVIGRKENHLFVVYELYSDQEPIVNHESVGYERFTLPTLSEQLGLLPEKFGDAFHFVIDTFYPELRS